MQPNNNKEKNNIIFHSLQLKFDMKQAVVRGTTNPAPGLPRSERPKTAISLHSQSLGGSTGLPEDRNQTK